MSEMMKNESITIDKRTLEFLLFSYFGKAKSAVEAAINVAYRDMAAHTLRRDVNGPHLVDKEDWEITKGKCKKKAINTIEKALNSLRDCTTQEEYCNWHKALCKNLKSDYCDFKAQLTFGQAQKWVNMTMKYLYMFYLLKKDGAMNHIFLDNEKQSHYNLDCELKDVIKNTWEFYHVPLDNYILKELYEKQDNKELNFKYIKIRKDSDTYKVEIEGKCYPWSRIPFDTDEKNVCKCYYNLQKELSGEIEKECSAMLLWEFENWLKTAMK